MVKVADLVVTVVVETVVVAATATVVVVHPVVAVPATVRPAKHNEKNPPAQQVITKR